MLKVAGRVLAGGQGRDCDKDRVAPPEGVTVLRRLHEGEALPMDTIKRLAAETHAKKIRKSSQRAPHSAPNRAPLSAVARLPVGARTPSARAYDKAAADARRKAAR